MIQSVLNVFLRKEDARKFDWLDGIMGIKPCDPLTSTRQIGCHCLRRQFLQAFLLKPRNLAC